MKMRIKGESLRLRLSKTDVRQLLEDGVVTETIYFGPDPHTRLLYSLQHEASSYPVRVTYNANQIVVIVPTADATRWAEGNEVGIYGDVDTGHGSLALSVEKDFACLDRDDADNADAFPNPNADGVCR